VTFPVSEVVWHLFIGDTLRRLLVVCFALCATDNTMAVTTRLSDEDKSQLERWKQMQQQQQQHGSDIQPSISNSVSTASHEVTVITTTAAAATAASNSSGLQLCSADSRLADRCLADTHLIWSPSVSLSSADIASYLQASDNSMQSAAGDGDGDNMITDAHPHCCAGYGIGETTPSSSNKYVV